MNLKEYLNGTSNEPDTFANCWLNNDPFAPDRKSARTFAIFPEDTALWIMDDWRTMIVILKANLETYNEFYKGT